MKRDYIVSIGDKIMAKVNLHLTILLTLLISVSSIDRVNISYAASQMNVDLGLTKATYGLGVSLFFVGYLLFQLPAPALYKKLGAKLWLSLCVISWGSVSLLMSFVRTGPEFYVLRVLLGICEAGFAPTVVAYLSSWMPQEYRARTVGITLLAVPFSVMFGGPISGGLIEFVPFEIAGWRFMFLIEGLVTILLGILAYVMLVNVPQQAKWLNDEEKNWLIVKKEAEIKELGERYGRPFIKLIQDPLLYVMAILWFALLTGSNALLFWLPQVLKSMTNMGDFMIGVISALPWLGLGLGMFISTKITDKTGTPIKTVGLFGILATFFFILSVSVPLGPLAFCFLVTGGFCLGGAQSSFWVVPTRIFGADASAIASVNFCGNLSGVISPIIIGKILEISHNQNLVVYVVASVILTGVAALALIPKKYNIPMGKEV